MKIIFDKIAEKVLTPEQMGIKPLLEEFAKTHLLVGGTAIALHLGHRRSIDFDFFRFGPQGTGKELFKRIQSTGLKMDKNSAFNYLSEEEESEIEFFCNGVKVQIMDFSRNPHNFPLSIDEKETVCDGIKTPSLEDLGSLKCYAMMYRKKWKDAVDLFFLLRKKDFSFSVIVENTENIFQSLYQPEATIENLLDPDWDKTESVEYLIENPPSDTEISTFLQEQAKIYLKNA